MAETNIRVESGGKKTNSAERISLIEAIFGKNGLETKTELLALEEKIKSDDLFTELVIALRDTYSIFNKVAFRRLFNDNIFITHGISTQQKEYSFLAYAKIMKLLKG